MKITIFGGTERTGKPLIEQALQRGTDVYGICSFEHSVRPSASSVRERRLEPESGYEAAARLVKSASKPSERFTAIMAANDHMALGALRALDAKGLKVPGQVSVVGYDDLPESRFFQPPLTTVHHDFAWEGERAMEMLFHAINQEPIASTLQVQHPGLIVRESTAPPNS